MASGGWGGRLAAGVGAQGLGVSLPAMLTDILQLLPSASHLPPHLYVACAGESGGLDPGSAGLVVGEGNGKGTRGRSLMGLF